MKRTHIILLVFIALSIGLLVSFMGNLSTYETIASARQKEGKKVTIIAKLDNSMPMEYNASKRSQLFQFLYCGYTGLEGQSSLPLWEAIRYGKGGTNRAKRKNERRCF